MNKEFSLSKPTSKNSFLSHFKSNYHISKFHKETIDKQYGIKKYPTWLTKKDLKFNVPDDKDIIWFMILTDIDTPTSEWVWHLSKWNEPLKKILQSETRYTPINIEERMILDLLES